MGGDVVADLGCGRGGYGLEIARRTGTRLVGVDFSTVAIERALGRHAQAWSDVEAEFRVGTLTASGLPAKSVAAVLCVDAMQFADPYEDGFAECRRVLRPGGRLVVTGWEPREAGDPAVPERLRRDIGAALVAAGFGDVRVSEKPAWQQAERAMWEAAAATEPDDDPALDSLRAEGTRVLTIIERVRRVLVTGRAPGQRVRP